MDTWRQRDAKRLQKQQYLAQAQKQPVPDTIAFNNKLQQWFSLSQSTHDESLQKQNHTLVDPDSLTTIFQYLSALQVAHSRLVSKTWNQIASSNSVRKLFARRDFGMNAQEMTDVEQNLGSSPNLWFCYYRTILSCIPIIIQEDPEQEPSQRPRSFPQYDSSYDDVDDFHEFCEEVSEMELLCHPKLVDYNVHRLCGVIGLLNCNGYVPKTRSHAPHRVLVGSCESSVYVEMPLLKICYAILTGNDSQLLKQHRGPVYVNEKEEEYEEDSFYFDDNIGISPYIAGPFSPFVFLNKMVGTKTDPQELDYQIEPDEDNAYVWESTDTEWAPVFFNASFRWVYECKMITSYLEESGIVRVTKLIERTPD